MSFYHLFIFRSCVRCEMSGASPSVNPSELLHLSWREPNLVPTLNPSNVLDYFSDKSNPFYDRQCNNEVLLTYWRKFRKLIIMIHHSILKCNTRDLTDWLICKAQNTDSFTTRTQFFMLYRYVDWTKLPVYKYCFTY